MIHLTKHPFVTSFAWLFTVIGLSYLVFSPNTMAQETDEQPPPSEPISDDNNNLFAKTVDAEEKTWLSVNGSRLLALYLKDTSGRPHGGVLIIPEAGRYPTSQGIINSLRHVLSKHHWHTLALDMTSDMSKSGEIDEKKVQEAITAGIKYLNEQGVYNIAILGEGIGAAHALHYAATLPDTRQEPGEFQQIRALIMINAKNTIPNSDINTLKAFDNVKLPILDAYSGADFLIQEQAKLRKTAARRTLNRYHQQVRLPKVAMYQQRQESRVTKQIRGWLDKNIAGFMVQEQR